MTPQAIIREIAAKADDALDGATSRAQARAGIEELITLDYLSTPPAEREQIVQGVMAILEREGFFDLSPGAGRGDDEETETGEDQG